ncbi:fibronectin type III domain containing protein 3C1 isoform X2 [Bactrocera oleae]|uniref:fibronectin type III domain containing protein 3C1 isoform X2 n=1 Tax=Bactrocera oleae TaxID=104688 RepID=UPI00387EE5A9
MAATVVSTQMSAIAASSHTIDSSQTVITDHRSSFFAKNTNIVKAKVSKNTPNSKVMLRSSKPTKALSAIPISTIRNQSLRSNLPFVQIFHTPSVTLARSLSCDDKDECSKRIVTAVGLTRMQCADNSTQTDTMCNTGQVFLTKKVHEQQGVNAELREEHNNQKDFLSSKTRKQSSMFNEICDESEGIIAIALDRKRENDSEKDVLEEENYFLFREMDFIGMKSECSRSSDDTETKSLTECDNAFKKPVSILGVEQSVINSDNIFGCKTHSNTEKFLESVECTCNDATQFNIDCDQTLANCTYQERIIDYDNFRIIEHVIDCANESFCKHGEEMKCDSPWKDTEEENKDQNKEMNLSCRELVAFIGESYQIINNERHSIVQNQEQPDLPVASSFNLDAHHSSNDNDEKNIYCSGELVIEPLPLNSEYANMNLHETLDNNNNKGYSKGKTQILNRSKIHPPENNKQILTTIDTTDSVSIESHAQTESLKRSKEQSMSTIQNSTPSMALALKALKSKLTPLAPSFHPAKKKSQPTSSTTTASSSMYAYEQTAIYYQQEPQLPKPQLSRPQQLATTTTVHKTNLQQQQLQVLPTVQPSYFKNYFQHQHYCSSLIQNLQQVHNFVISSNEHSQHCDELGNISQTHLNSAPSSVAVAIQTSALPVAVANPTQQAQLYPVQLISLATPTLVADASRTFGQRQQPCTTSATVTTVGNGSTPWPLLEAAPFFIDPHGELHTFCPTHGHAALNAASVETVVNPQCVPFNQATLSSTRSNISQSLHSKQYQNTLQNQTRPLTLTTVPVAKVSTTNHQLVQNAKAKNQNHNQTQNHQLRHQQQLQQPQAHYHQQQQQQKFDSGIILNISGKGKLHRGPATVQMVSQNRPPSITVPVQVPQGQMMQQYVNENGTFAHVVLSPQYQQIHSGQGHMHAPFMQAGGSSQFYPTLPAGFAPNPGSGPAHFHTLTSGHVQTQQLSQHQKATTQPQQTGSQTLSHSPSPPNSYHKDERTQRQHTKLLRKLEKQREMTPPRCSDLNGYHNLSVNSANSSPVNGTNNHDHVIATSGVSPSDTANSNSSVKSSSDNGLGVVQSVLNINKSLVQLKQDTSPLRQPLKKNILHSQTTQRNGSIAPNVSPSGLSYGVKIASSKGDKGEFNSNIFADEEDTQALIIEQLSAIQKPNVINLTSRSAKIIWEGPIMTDSQIDTKNLRYNVLLSDRAKDGKYKSLYKGDSYDCIVQDLQPGQTYVVRVQVYYNKLQGTASEASEFMTPPCEPDQPTPPKLVMRTKNSLHLRWSNPPSNGSPIQHYLLEYDDGKSGLSLSTRASLQNIENEDHNFVEATKTKGKHYTLTKLLPSTVYYFRLAAVNDVGMSLYSTICSYCTSNNPPIAPKPPKLQSCSSTTIRLWWERRQQDGDYVLQILDPDSGHGFLNAYNGPDTSHECCELRRATYYQFRLRAENEAGSSPWSNEVTYQTAPEKPGKPGKPHLKGKIHGTHFRARWDPPTDMGGAEIIRYFLEITSGAKFERIYSGTDTESICDRLQPGTTYQLRASCEGPAGISPYSDVAHITSEALVPAAPSPPYYDSPPGPYAAVLRLDKPENNGGAPILELEVQMRHSVDDKYAIANKTNDYSIVYHGRDTFCVVKDLQPGWSYEVQVRAINRIGAGPWSSWFRFAAAAAPPNVPENLNVIIKSATHLLVNWEEPSNNGAPIQEYRLESLTVENESDLSLENSSQTSAYHTCYHGGQTSIDLRNLSPFTIYYFRVNASNAAGVSKWSTCINARTPAAVPAAPQIKDCEFTAKKVVLNWSKPECNGACITGYTIECADKSITIADANTTYTIQDLMPETTYKIRLQAINSIGGGPFSSYTKFTTLPSPPAPPSLECTGVGHNFIKLKWGDGKNVDFIKYYVEMFVQRAKEFQIVYSGTSCMCKVNKLQESTAYTFRVYASTDRAGIGEFSDEYIFSTTPTLPSNIKAPRVAMEGAAACLLTHGVGSASSFVPSGILPETPTSFIAGLGNLSLGVPLTLEWQNSKNSFNDPVEYVLQYAIGKDGDYRRIYRGPETKFTIENLEPGTMYQFRVYPIRVTKSGEDLVGQYTSAFRYQVPHLAALDDIDGNLLGNMGSVFGTGGRGINNSNNGSMNCHGHSHLAHHVHSLHTHHSHSHTHHNSRQSITSLHHRSVSASAASPNGFNGHSNTNINDSSNNSGSTILIGPNAIGLIPLGTSMTNELTTVEFAGCDDPLHHHHHHHQFLGGNVSPGSDSVGSAPTTTSFLAAASNNSLTNNALLVHGIGLSNHTQNGVLRRYMTKLTTIYTNRKRFTDQEKAVLFMKITIVEEDYASLL